MGPNLFLGGIAVKIAISMTAWRRPDYFEQVLDSIVEATGTTYPIHISIDGGYAEEQLAMRKIAKHKIPNASVYAHQQNLGCANNTHYALARAFQDPSIEAVIHLEDDTMLHPQFFEFMHQALEHYANEPRIFSVSGYKGRANQRMASRMLTENWGGNNVGLQRFFTCWGWGTWRRVWDEVKQEWFGIHWKDDYPGEVEGQEFMDSIVKNPKGSWAQPLNHWWRHKGNRLEVLPDESLVQNIGREEGMFVGPLDHDLQQTPMFNAQKRYESWDFEMADMELAERPLPRIDPRPVEWWEAIE
jgi:hypothetical protein